MENLEFMNNLKLLPWILGVPWLHSNATYLNDKWELTNLVQVIRLMSSKSHILQTWFKLSDEVRKKSGKNFGEKICSKYALASSIMM